MVPASTRPSAVKISKQAELLPKHPTGTISTAVMVAKNDRLGVGQGCDPTGQTQITVTEIAHKQRQVRLQLRQELLVSVTPGSMQITGNGDAESVQSGCLVWLHPARLRIR